MIRILDLGRSEKKTHILPYKVFYLISVSVSLFDKRCVLVKLSCNRKNSNLLLFFLCTSIYSSLLKMYYLTKVLGLLKSRSLSNCHSLPRWIESPFAILVLTLPSLLSEIPQNGSDFFRWWRLKKIDLKNTSWICRFRKLKSVGRKRGGDETNSETFFIAVINSVKVICWYLFSWLQFWKINNNKYNNE